MASVVNGRAFGIIALVIQIGMLFAYGFGGGMFNESSITSANTTWAFNYIMTSVLAVLGYGLILSYYKFSVISSFFTTLFVVSFTTLFCPLLLKFWHKVFIYGFNNNQVPNAADYSYQNYQYLFYQGTSSISPSYYLMRLCIFCSISQLVMLTVIIGRIALLESIVSSIIFNCTWTFALILNISIQRKSQDLKFMDDFFISNIYLFGSAFGLIAAIYVRKSPSELKEYCTNRMSTIIALMGTFFVFLSFGASSALFPLKSSSNAYAHNAGAFNIFLAMSASTVSTIAVTLIYSQKLNLRAIVWSTIMGGVLFGSVANSVQKPAGGIALGTLAGIFSCLYFQIIFPKLKAKLIFDSHGVIGTFLINSFLSTLFCAPIVIAALYNTAAQWGTVGLLQSKKPAGYVLIFSILSLVFGCIGGAIFALFCKCFSFTSNSQDYRNTLILSADYGLGNVEEKRESAKIEKKSSNPSEIILKSKSSRIRTPSADIMVKGNTINL